MHQNLYSVQARGNDITDKNVHDISEGMAGAAKQVRESEWYDDGVVLADITPSTIGGNPPQNKDGFIDSDYNVQMMDTRQLPNDDGLYSIDDVATIESLKVMLTNVDMLIDNLRGGQTSITTEDSGEAENGIATAANLMEQIEYADDAFLRASTRVDQVQIVADDIEDLGGVSKDQAAIVEGLHEGIITARASLESFSKWPTQTNLKITLEAINELTVGALAVGAIAVIGALAKLFDWIIRKLEATLAIPYNLDDTIRANAAKLATMVEKYDKRNPQKQVMQKSIITAIATQTARANMSVKIPENSNYSTANQILLESIYMRKIKSHNCKLMTELLEQGDSSARLTTRFIADAFMKIEDDLIKKFEQFRNHSGDDGLLEFGLYEIDVTSVAPALKPYKVTAPFDSDKAALGLKEHIAQLVEPDDSLPVVNYFDSNAKLNYDFQVAYSVNGSNARKIKRLQSDLVKIQKEVEQITDVGIRKNRLEILKNMERAAKTLSILLDALVLIRDTAKYQVTKAEASLNSTRRLWGVLGVDFGK